MIGRHPLQQSNDALMQARDLTVVLTYAVRCADDITEGRLRDLVASMDTALEQIVGLIQTAKEPIHEALVHAGAADLRAVSAKGGAR